MKSRTKNAISKASRLVGKMKPKSTVIGYVEEFDSSHIAGWSFTRSDEGLIELSISIDGSIHELNPSWFERADVAQQHGHQYLKAGFRCELTRNIAKLINEALRNTAPIKVFANRIPLVIACPSPRPLVDLKQEPVNLKPSVKSDDENQELIRKDMLEGELESCGHFIIHGWAMQRNEAVNIFSLLCNGKEIDCTVLRNDRSDIVQTGEVATKTIGYEIDLPGYMWEGVLENNDINITVLADGNKLNSEPLVLSREKALEWISEISTMEEGRAKQYMSLLALEQLHYSGMFEKLELPVKQYYHDLAQETQLSDYFGEETKRKDLFTIPEQNEDTNTHFYWKTMLELNGRLADKSRTAFEHVKETEKKMCLTVEVKKSFFKSIIPLFCRYDEFLDCRQLTDFKSFYSLEHAEGIWDMSLALAPLVADKLIGRATNLLWRIGKQLNNGWLNTECVHFTVRHLQELERRGEVDLPTAERFRYAIIGLLDGFQGEWFSSFT